PIGYDAYAVDAASALQHFVEGTGWQQDATPPGVTLDSVTLLAGLDGALALAGVDTQLQPHLWTRDAATWSEVPGLGARDLLYAAASDGTNAFVGGNDGALYRVSGGSL